jgi:hypothetical protein
MAFRPTEAELDGAMLELEQCFQGSGSKGRDWGKMRSYAQMVCTVRHLARLPQSETPAQPKGWKLVPLNPTEAMFRAGDDASFEDTNFKEACKFMRKLWNTMLAAAPSPDGNDNETGGAR